MEEVLSKRLHVGGLHAYADKNALRALFSRAGQVVDVYTPFQRRDLESGAERPRNRGFAFVEMGTREEAERAIQMLHQKPGPHGWVITVCPVNQKNSRKGTV